MIPFYVFYASTVYATLFMQNVTFHYKLDGNSDGVFREVTSFPIQNKDIRRYVERERESDIARKRKRWVSRTCCTHSLHQSQNMRRTDAFRCFTNFIVNENKTVALVRLSHQSFYHLHFPNTVHNFEIMISPSLLWLSLESQCCRCSIQIWKFRNGNCIQKLIICCWLRLMYLCWGWYLVCMWDESVWHEFAPLLDADYCFRKPQFVSYEVDGEHSFDELITHELNIAAAL